MVFSVSSDAGILIQTYICLYARIYIGDLCKPRIKYTHGSYIHRIPHMRQTPYGRAPYTPTNTHTHIAIHARDRQMYSYAHRICMYIYTHTYIYMHLFAYHMKKHEVCMYIFYVCIYSYIK